MLPILHIGPLAIQTPGLLLLLGLWLGISLAGKHSPRYGIPANHIYTFSIGAVVFSAITARLVYTILNIAIFVETPGSIISLNPGLLDPLGAILGLALFAIYFTLRHKYNAWSLLDALMPILAVLMIAISMANLASGKGFGFPTRFPWAIYLFGAWRHPTQVFEMIAAGVALFIFWPGSRRSLFAQRGIYGLCVIAVTAANRLFFEVFRADSNLITGGLRSAQVTAWLILAITFWLILLRAGESNG